MILAAERREREKRKKNRQRIPAGGRTWLDRSDIDNFFANQEEEREKKMKVKEERIQKAIGRQHTLLKEIERKKTQAIRYEQQGSLPRTWKTSGQHEVEEKKAHEKLASLLATQDNLLRMARFGEGNDCSSEDEVGEQVCFHGMGFRDAENVRENSGNSDVSKAATPCPVVF